MPLRLWPALALASLTLCCTTLQAQPAAAGGPPPGGPAPGAGGMGVPGAYGYGPMRPGAQRPGARTSPSAGREAAAAVSAGLDKLFEFMRASEVPNKLQTAAFLDREIAPYFDFDYMARFVAGRDWQRMSEEQRTALAAQLESRILSGLASRLVQFSDQKVRYLRPRPGARGSVDVQVGLRSPGAYPAKLVFRLYPSSDDWQVYDLIAEGRSLLAFYRGAFAQQVGAQAQGR